jgi:hypothetical protein
MNSKITKHDVFLYFADQLDRARRMEIEAACATDARVRQWFDELSPTSEELATMPVPEVATDTPEYRRLAVLAHQGVSRDSEGLKELIRLLLATPEGHSIPSTKPLLADSGAWDWPSLVDEMAAVGATAADSSDETARPQLPDTPYEVFTDTAIYLGRTDAEVPFGVVRIIAARNGVPLTSIVRVMEFDERTGSWKLEIPKAALFKEKIPPGKIEYYFACGTDADSLRLFSHAQVAELYQELPEEFIEERKRVKQLLDLLSDLEEKDHAV